MDDNVRDRTGLAIALSLAALSLYASMGLVIKFLSPNYSPAELSAYRNFVGLIPSLLALLTSPGWHRSGRSLRLRQWKLAAFRGLCVTFAQFMFYLSLAHIAFATATTISYATSLFMTALAIPLLGERVGAIRWTAVLIGFLGVLWIMKPGADGFTVFSVTALAAAFGYALTGVLSRKFDVEAPSALINLHTSTAGMISSTALVFAFGGFTPVSSMADVGWILAMGGFGGTATLLLTISYRMTEQSNLAPFQYFGIPIAFFLGWTFFREAPFEDLFPGALLIILGGMIVIWRERRVKV